jgi:phosphoribosylanthranilate isomerase
MWVKICANTCVEDALKAAELGADAVGFVFAPSKRRVTAAQVAPIAAELPPHVERVGVFSGDTAEAIAHAVETARLTAVQLHGGFDPVLTERLEEFLDPSISVIQTVHWDVGLDASAMGDEVAEKLAQIASYTPDARVLIDAKVGSASGGTGVSFAWAGAAPVLASQPGLRIILAGGLRPDDVAEAIRTLRPWGVDVASGVEREPGRKDFAKLKSFIENARGAAS